jgi:tetratricopeptide (TPR) repeat protein
MLKVILLIATLMPFFGAGQVCSFTKDLDQGNNLCNLISGQNRINITQDKNADIAIDKILSVIGARKKFIIQQCDKIQNAVATSYKGVRYIIYDKEFMNSIANNTNSWSSLSILAHEVGHHINGHSLDLTLYATNIVKPISLAQQRDQELEADEFSGYVLQKLGATLNEASEAISLLSSNDNDTYSTHPNKNKRLDAISFGYSRAKTQNGKYREKAGNLTAEDYFYRAREKESFNDFTGAIDDLTKAITISPNMGDAYWGRGYIKYNGLNDYNGAFSDFKEALNLDSSNAWDWYHCGFILFYDMHADASEAIKYFSRAIDLYRKKVRDEGDNSNFAGCYIDRGKAKASLFDEENGLSALDDFNKAIEINPRDGDSYYYRGLILRDYNRFDEACKDFRTAINLGSGEVERSKDIIAEVFAICNNTKKKVNNNKKTHLIKKQ